MAFVPVLVIPSLPPFVERAKKDDDDIDDAQLPALVHIRDCEPVGLWFDARLEPEPGTGSPTSPSRASPTGGAGSGEAGGQRQRKAFDSRKAAKLSEEEVATDWYEVLRLDKAELATEDEIRAAYRRRCLETHPDKQPSRSDVEFKQVQRAFDILGNEEMRRAFDSARPFDDSIPGEEVAEEEFYSAFGKCFERNKKWGIDPVIPSLGDASTPLADVNRFYNFWMTFKSWRDFSHEVEVEEIHEGMCREEKRFYQRENQRLLEKARRQEAKRVRTLVERAMHNDPRLRAKRLEEQQKREKEIAERHAERERLREEDRRQKQELADEERRKEEARVQAIKDARAAIKAAMVELQSFITGAGLLDDVKTNKLLPDKIRSPNITWLFQKVDPEMARGFVSSVVGKNTAIGDDGTVEAVSAFNELVTQRERDIGMTRFGEPVAREKPGPSTSAAKGSSGAASAAELASAARWSEDDLLLLQKAIAAYPGGTVDRWRRISTMLRNKFSEEEVLVKTKEMEKIWRTDKSVMQQRMPRLPAATHADPAAAAAGATDSTPSAAPAVVPSKAGGGGAAPGSIAATSAVKAAAADVEDWTAKQQRQLELGLRDLKDYKEKDKFNKIAANVDGKTAKQCFERFKYLCSLNKKK